MPGEIFGSSYGIRKVIGVQREERSFMRSQGLARLHNS